MSLVAAAIRFGYKRSLALHAIFFLLVSAVTELCPAADVPDTTSPAQAPSKVPAPTAQDLITKASQEASDGKLDQAIDDANFAIQLDPKLAAAYELRGSIYIQKKFWDRAERDYTKANEISPDAAFQYKLGQIKYLQRSYGDARFRFSQLQKDPRLGDVSKYMVFMCDLLGGHQAIASQDLAAIDGTSKTPAYYYAHGSWCLYHSNRPEMVKFFTSASKLYDESTQNLYLSAIMAAQRFHPKVASFTTKDGQKFENTSIFLDSTGLNVTTAKGWIRLPLDQLPDELSGFPDEIKDQIIKMRAKVSDNEKVPANMVSFTTKAGKTYSDVRWALEDTGVAILGKDGWVTVPFDQLPDDLSPFPAKSQQAIAERRSSEATTPSRESVISFTTKQGKKYDQVRALATENGLRVLSSNGWVEIPFDQFPADVSSFPSNLQKIIEDQRKFGASGSGLEHVVSFTTRAGKHYDQVRTMLMETGLRVLSPDGWVVVNFAELPRDLTPFPQEWRARIRAGDQSDSTNPGGKKMVSFTTKQGKEYDDVRASVGRNGLRVLTEDGFIAIPYDQLPDDLSAFPPEWREKITANRKNGILPKPPAPPDQ